MNNAIPELKDFLKRNEGFRAAPYKDVNGWAIGYGKYSPEKPTIESVTEEEADLMLDEDISRSVKSVDKYVKEKYGIGVDRLAPNQVAALAEVVFSTGDLGKFPKYTDAVVAGDWDTAAKEIRERGYRGKDGKIIPLSNRNEDVIGTFLNGDATSVVKEEAPGERQTVRMPDGNIVEGVPKDMTNDDLMAWYKMRQARKGYQNSGAFVKAMLGTRALVSTGHQMWGGLLGAFGGAAASLPKLVVGDTDGVVETLDSAQQFMLNAVSALNEATGSNQHADQAVMGVVGSMLEAYDNIFWNVGTLVQDASNIIGLPKPAGDIGATTTYAASQFATDYFLGLGAIKGARAMRGAGKASKEALRQERNVIVGEFEDLPALPDKRPRALALEDKRPRMPDFAVDRNRNVIIRGQPPSSSRALVPSGPRTTFPSTERALVPQDGLYYIDANGVIRPSAIIPKRATPGALQKREAMKAGAILPTREAGTGAPMMSYAEFLVRSGVTSATKGTREAYHLYAEEVAAFNNSLLGAVVREVQQARLTKSGNAAAQAAARIASSRNIPYTPPVLSKTKFSDIVNKDRGNKGLAPYSASHLEKLYRDYLNNYPNVGFDNPALAVDPLSAMPGYLKSLRKLIPTGRNATSVMNGQRWAWLQEKNFWTDPESAGMRNALLGDLLEEQVTSRNMPSVISRPKIGMQEKQAAESASRSPRGRLGGGARGGRRSQTGGISPDLLVPKFIEDFFKDLKAGKRFDAKLSPQWLSGAVEVANHNLMGQSISRLRDFYVANVDKVPSLGPLLDRFSYPERVEVRARLGAGQAAPDTIGHSVRMREMQSKWMTAVEGAMSQFKPTTAPAVTSFFGRLSEKSNDMLLAGLLRRDYKGMTKAQIAATQAIRDVYNDIYKTAAAVGVPVKFYREDFLPLVMNRGVIERSPDVFSKEVLEGLARKSPAEAQAYLHQLKFSGNESGIPGSPKFIREKIQEKLESGDTSMFESPAKFSGFMMELRRGAKQAGHLEHVRLLDNVDLMDMKDWIITDVPTLTSTYITDASRRIASAIQFGPNEELLAEGIMKSLNEMVHNGVPVPRWFLRDIFEQADLHQFGALPDKRMGPSGKAATGAFTTAQNVLVLPSIVLGSLAEMALPALRHGVMRWLPSLTQAVLKDVTTGLARELVSSRIPRNQIMDLANSLGKGTGQMLTQSVSNKLTSFSSMANKGFFKAVGFHGWNFLIHHAALRTVINDLSGLSKSLYSLQKAGKLDRANTLLADRRELMTWLGFNEADMIEWAKRGARLDDKIVQEKFRPGLIRGVEQAVVSGDPSKLATIYGNELGIWVTHLVRYPHLVGTSVWKEAITSTADNLLKLTGLRPGDGRTKVAMSAQSSAELIKLAEALVLTTVLAEIGFEIRDIQKYGSKGNPGYRDEPLHSPKKIIRGFEQTGTLGGWQRVLNAVRAKEEWGGSPSDAMFSAGTAWLTEFFLSTIAAGRYYASGGEAGNTRQLAKLAANSVFLLNATVEERGDLFPGTKKMTDDFNAYLQVYGPPSRKKKSTSKGRYGSRGGDSGGRYGGRY